MTLYGVDIHPQYQAGISLPRLREEGYSFLVTKASEGLHIPSTGGMSAAAFKSRYLGWVAQCRTLGMVPGLYHWLRAGQGAEQARFFYALVREAGGPDGMIIQLDDEDNASYQDTADFLREWAQLSGGHPVLIYTGKWWWGPRSWDGQALTPYLWHSQYLTADTDTISDDPAAFAARIPGSWWTPGYGGWPSATFLQFTSRGDAGSLGNNVDLNAFRGTIAELRALTTGDRDMDQSDKLVRPTGNTGRTFGDFLADLQILRNVFWGEGIPPEAVPPKPDALIFQLLALPTKLAALQTAVDGMKAGSIDYPRLAAEIVKLLPHQPTREEIGEVAVEAVGERLTPR